MIPLLSYMSLLRRYNTIHESRIPIPISLLWPVCRSICLILLVIYVSLHHYIENVVIANTKFEWSDCQTLQLLYTYVYAYTWAWLVVYVWQFSNVVHCKKFTLKKIIFVPNWFWQISANLQWSAIIENNAIVSNSMEMICI